MTIDEKEKKFSTKFRQTESSIISEGLYTIWPTRIYPRNAGLVYHMEINVTIIVKDRNHIIITVVAQSLSYVGLLATQWTAAHQDYPSFTVSQSLPKLMSIELVMPSVFNWCLQSFPASGSFPMSQVFTSGDQSIGASVSVSVLPMNIQGWFPLEWTGLFSFLSKGLSRVFSSTRVPKHQFFDAGPTLISVYDY